MFTHRKSKHLSKNRPAPLKEYGKVTIVTTRKPTLDHSGEKKNFGKAMKCESRWTDNIKPGFIVNSRQG